MTGSSADMVHLPAAPQIFRFSRQTSGLDIVRLPAGSRHVILHLEEGAQVVVSGHCAASTVEAVLEDGARLEILRVVQGDGVAPCTAHLYARLARESSLRSFFITRGASGVSDEIKVALEGEGAEVFLNGLHMLAGEARAESSTYIEHAAPSTTSDQLYKCLLRDTAYSLFHGRIMVRREAQLTNAFQLNKNMLLSARARADVRPELEIFADDVKCSHGATIGHLDDEQLFYLQTRGIDKVVAGEMLLDGFVEDVVGRICAPCLKDEVNKNLR